MKSILRLMIVIVALAASMWAADPFLGTWKLDPSRSKYPPGTCPQSMSIQMSAAGNGVHYLSDATYANGRTTRSEYTAEYDGKEAIVMGAHGLLLPVTLKRIDANTVEAVYHRGFQVIATSRRVLSPDRNTMIITTVSRDTMGKNVTNVGFYKRADNAVAIAK